MYLSEYTGRGVRIAVIDSGIHAGHPHVGGVDEGVAIGSDGATDGDFADGLGHGTAVAAAIREKAPDAGLVAVRIFRRTLSTGVASLVRGIDEASSRGVALMNLSLGTANPAHREALTEAVGRARARGALLVAARDDHGVEWLPGSLEGVLPVRLDWACARDAYRIEVVDGGRVIVTSGYPRDIPGVPRERNLKGISFAVANACGFAARALEAAPGARPEDLLAILDGAGHER